METIASFGYWIRRQRKALDLTQQLLADQVGCSLAAIKKIERDERRPSRQIADLLADVLGVPASQRETFLEVARGLRPVGQLSLAREPAIPVPSETPKSSPHNLPIQLTSFIGRERELIEIKQLLSNTRLLTLTGPGGAGKTRLALQIAEKLLPSFADGVWLAESAPLTDASLLPQTIAGIFGLRELPNMHILNIVTDYLRAKQLLLILDNCEHLIEACAKLSDHLLRACPKLKIIASSREALSIAGETAYRVPSLSLPDQVQVTREAAMGFESIQLFVERASAANPKFHITDENVSDVAQICRHLDGIPLALELAATRIRVFSTEEIAARLDDRFSLLIGGSRTASERHQTLRALIDWSYELLSHDERRLFRHFSVFAGGWTFEAAEVVCQDLDVLNLLTQLVDKSLVMVDTDRQESSTRYPSGGSLRYHLLDTIRQYASEKLLEAGEFGQARARHMDFFLKFAEEAELHFNGPHELDWISRLAPDDENLRTAFKWALENNVEKALRLGSALYHFWSRHGYIVEGHRLLTEAVARVRALPPAQGKAAGERIAILARALNAVGVLGYGKGDFLGSVQVFEEAVDLSRQISEKHSLLQALSFLVNASVYLGFGERDYHRAEEALRLAREVGDKTWLGLALINMAGTVAMEHGDPKTAQAYGEEGLQLLNAQGNHWTIAYALLGMGRFAARLGNYAEARSRFEDCLPLFAKLNDRLRTIMVRSEIAHLERRQGHIAQAKSLYRETILQWQDLGHRAAIAHELECLAFIAKMEEEGERAAILFGAAEMLRENIHIPMTPLERTEYEREVNDLCANIDEVAFKRAWTEGRGLTMEQAIQYGLSGTGE